MVRFSEMEQKDKFSVSNLGDNLVSTHPTTTDTEPKFPVEPNKTRGRGRPRGTGGLNRAKKLMKVGRRRFGWKSGNRGRKPSIIRE